MFERFTDRARRVVVLAQEEARMLNHNYIGTEHILLGLIREGSSGVTPLAESGIASQVLIGLELDLVNVRMAVIERIGEGLQPVSGHIPFTPRTKRVIELSLREALQLGHTYIGTEHILLAFIHEGEGVGAEVLASFGLPLEQIRKAVIVKLNGRYETKPAIAAPLPSTSTEEDAATQELKKLLLALEALLLPLALEGDLKAIELLLNSISLRLKT